MIKHITASVTLAWVIAAWMLPVLVEAQDERTSFAAGEAHFAAEDYAAALTEFQAARDSGLDTAAANYNIAVCYYKLGDYANAAAAFRDLANRYPAFRELADYNLGLALQKMGRTQEARDAFRRASASQEPKIAALANALLGEPEPPAISAAERSNQRWARLVDFSIGHDDNVVLIDDASLPVGQSADSPFGEVFGLISGPLGANSRLRFDLSAYLVAYPDVDQFDQTVIQTGLGYVSRWRAWQLEFGPRYSYATLGGDGFESRFSAVVEARRNLGSRTEVRILGARDEVDSVDVKYDFVEGERVYSRIAFVRDLANAQLGLDFQYEDNDRVGVAVSSVRDTVTLRYRRRIGASWTVDAKLTDRSSRYQRIATPRNERLQQLTLAMTRQMASRWDFTVRYALSENDSNDPTFSYRRQRITVGMTRAF